MDSKASKLVVLYDGKCVLCCQSVRVIRVLDWLNKVDTLDLHNADVADRFSHFDKEKLLGEMHAITPQDETNAGFFAIRYINRVLPLGWLTLPIFYLPGMNWLGPKLYQWVAQRRYRLNQAFGADLCEDGVCKIKYD